MQQSTLIRAVDGYALGANVYGTNHSESDVIVINGATGVRQKYYSRFATWLALQGFTVITYDYRGIGESRPAKLRGFEASLRDWGQLDFEGVLRFARAQSADGRRVGVIGHSVGGQLLGLAPSNGHLSAAVTVGSQSGYWRHWPLEHRYLMFGLWHALMPAVSTVVGYLPGSLGIGEDLPKEVALEWARWCRQSQYFFDCGISSDGFERLSMPISAFSFSDDLYAPKEAVDWLHRQFRNARVNRQHLTPSMLQVKRVGHFGPFSPVFRDALWPRIAGGFQMQNLRL